eukprot:gnl/Hemi2/14867_TR5044_c0_g1_i1.p1 gnl/Hemi2/14867_TR5044_c0_g1~~gnl/Hemi2/14867_TR5044_c0_g1_i1.p1  ORF type:complete len:213 (+),score=21.69 gnl/Hemi2/14867_TR5044_c0_g1_i1:56-694(+)
MSVASDADAQFDVEQPPDSAANKKRLRRKKRPTLQPDAASDSKEPAAEDAKAEDDFGDVVVEGFIVPEDADYDESVQQIGDHPNGISMKRSASGPRLGPSPSFESRRPRPVLAFSQSGRVLSPPMQFNNVDERTLEEKRQHLKKKEKKKRRDTIISWVLVVAGLFLCFPWICALGYFRSKSIPARVAAFIAVSLLIAVCVALIVALLPTVSK